jgi:hypothetical protein
MTTKGWPLHQSGRESPGMRKLFLLALAGLIVAALTTGRATGEGFQGRDDDGQDDDRHGRGA